MEFKTKPKTALEAASRPRPYVHFDLPFEKGDTESIQTIVADPSAVCRHSFYPFLRLDLIRNKVKKLPGGKKEFDLKIREIRYASHKDSAIYAYYNFLLSEKYENRVSALGIDTEIVAFRSLGKSNIDFAAEAFDWIKKSTPCVALGFDVKDFFGSLDHALLKKQWAAVLGETSLPDDHYSVFRAITKHASVELIEARKKLGISRSKLEKSKKFCSAEEFRCVIRDGGLINVNKNNFGIPQGSPISALLSNLYLLPFDEKIKIHTKKWNGFYRRYCDDILIVVPIAHKNEACEKVKELLKELKLEVQDKKTLVCTFTPVADRPLQYLGFLFDGINIYLRSGGIARFFKKMRAGVRLHTKAKRKDGKTLLHVQRRKKLLNAYTEHAPEKARSYMNYVKRTAHKTDSDSPIRQLKAHKKKFKKLIEE